MMVVRIVHDDGKHDSFYEGSHITFHISGGGVEVVVERHKDKEPVTIGIDRDSNTQIYLMNDQGKTVEKIFV